MGKWSHLRGKYPAREFALHDKVSEYELKTTDELETMVSEFDQKRKTLEAAKKDNQINLDASTAVLLKRWEANGNTQQIKRDSVGTLSRIDDIYTTIKDLEEFKAWALENGVIDMVKEAVNNKSLTTLIKDLLTEGAALPESVEIFTKSRIRASQSTTKEESDE